MKHITNAAGQELQIVETCDLCGAYTGSLCFQYGSQRYQDQQMEIVANRTHFCSDCNYQIYQIMKEKNMKLKEIYDSLDRALVADKSPATEYALAELRKHSERSVLREKNEVVAILSTTVLPKDGLYDVRTFSAVPVLHGLPHYCGHPATAAIIENLGAIKAESKLFSGLEVGQAAISCSIKQGQSTRAKDGFTSPHQDVTDENLEFRLITRLE